MSFGAALDTNRGTTPGRYSVLELDHSFVGLARSYWSLSRAGAEIGQRVNNRLQSSSGVRLLPGGAWAMAPFGGYPERIFEQDWQDAIVSPADMNLPAGWAEVKMFRKPEGTDIGAGSSVISSGVPAVQKRVAAGESWETNLADSQTAQPSPPASGPDWAIDRVIETKTSFPENSGFSLSVGYPANPSIPGPADFIAVVFGGDTDVTPEGSNGGQFFLALNGDGGARLEEYTGAETRNGWTIRKQFRWSGDVNSAQAHIVAISVTPYGRNRIALQVRVADNAVPDVGIAGFYVTSRVTRPQAVLYEGTRPATGIEHLHYATGPGALKVDMRRNLRLPVLIKRHKFAETAVLVDAPFDIETEPPAGTALVVTTDTYLLPNTGVSVALYDATTGELLETNEDGNFLTNAGVSTYFAKFTLTSSPDRFNTPILFGYKVTCAGTTRSHDGTPVLVKPRAYSVTGPDVTPEHESAEIQLSDLTDSLLTLRARDGIYSRLAIREQGTGTLLTYLLEGETTRTPARLRGKPNSTYPAEGWRDYDVRMLGLWTRLAEQFNIDLEDFSRDPNAPIDPNTVQQQQLAWKITDIIRWWFQRCGVPDDELDIPDYSVRLFEAGSTLGQQLPKDVFTPQFGADSSRAILTLVRDFLGHYLFRDPNASKTAGARGLWRVVRPKNGTESNYLFDIHLRRPTGSAGKSPTRFGTYGAADAWVYRDSFMSYTRRPEANVCYVYGVANGADEGGNSLIKEVYPTSGSVNRSVFDPTYPGYLGRVVPLIRVDSNITTRETARFLARRYYRIACLPQKWFECRLPLLLVTDPQDLYQVRQRVPRMNDLCRIIDGATVYPAIIRSCTPVVDRNDAVQAMDIEGMFLTDEMLENV